MWRSGAREPLIGMGCMRLSTDPDRDETRAIAVLRAAFDAGVNFLDTADAYCRDATETGHNERLIARALTSWGGDRARIVVATKGGLTRPDGRWVPDGRARHLAAACEASRTALGVDRISLYQLHAPDPRASLSTSMRALAALRRDGLVDSIGVCNVTVGQIEEARRITEIASVQAELSVWRDQNFLSGVAEYCVKHGLPLLAHRPLGGSERRRRTMSDPTLCEVAARHGATPFEIALAWLADLSPLIVPIPGATRVETAQSIARARTIALTDEDRARLADRFPSGRALRVSAASNRPLVSPVDGEVVIIMGLPAAGKSTVAATFVAQGYTRLNRDESGGSLSGLLPAFDRAITAGASRIVLDNTYVSRTSRASVIRAASERGLAVRCLWLSTSIEDAQTNAVSRMISRHGKLLAVDEIKKPRKKGPAPLVASGDIEQLSPIVNNGAGPFFQAFAPTVQFRYQRELEPPDVAEGFSRVEVMPFERRRNPAFVNRALIVWCDGVLLRSRSGSRTPTSQDDVEVLAERGAVLRRHQDEGWRLLGMSWQPEIAEGAQSSAAVESIFARMNEQLGLSIDVEYCPHAGGPPTCWCRKPLPGLGVVFIERYYLDPLQCIYIGIGPQDPGFARRLGFQYRSADQFFA